MISRTIIVTAPVMVRSSQLSYAKIRADLNAVVSDALHFHTKHVMWPWTHYLSSAACQNVGERLADVGAMLREFGIRFSFHDHAREFQLVEGRTVFDWILSAAAARDLAAEPDVFWIHQGGYSPANGLRDAADPYSGR